MFYLLSFVTVIITVFLVNLIWGSGNILKVLTTGLILFTIGTILQLIGLGFLGAIINLIVGFILFSKFLDIDGTSLVISVIVYNVFIFAVGFILVGMFVIH